MKIEELQAILKLLPPGTKLEFRRGEKECKVRIEILSFRGKAKLIINLQDELLPAAKNNP